MLEIGVGMPVEATYGSGNIIAEAAISEQLDINTEEFAFLSTTDLIAT